MLDDDGQAIYRDGPVVVISNTCDSQPARDDYVLICPMFTVAERLASITLTGQQLADHISDLKRNRITNLMFFPTVRTMPDSWLDFSKTCAVSSEYFYSLHVGEHRVASLSQKGHYFFLMKLAYHFCRPEDASEAKRTASE